MQIVRTWEEVEDGSGHSFVHIELEHEGKTYLQRYHSESLRYGLATVKRNATKRAWGEVEVAKRLQKSG